MQHNRDLSTFVRRQNRSPLGLPLEPRRGSEDEKFCFWVQRGNYKAAEALQPFVTRLYWFEYLFLRGRLDAARALLQSGGQHYRPCIPAYIFNLYCSESKDPALVFAAQEFVFEFENCRRPQTLHYANGLLKPLREGEDPSDCFRFKNLLGPVETWVTSPTIARVRVYNYSAEHRLCMVMRRGRGVSLSTLDLFNGRVARPLLAEALYAAGAIKAFESMLRRYPECIGYINGLHESIPGIQSGVGDIQSHVRSMLARQAAISALEELA